ncbi:hypothetical protein AeMF1_012336 [Aphanomyces euteiches]|nr:hypothetical protein AeMF1_012336 [Aphanomyces euteiches]KAH9186536.1 hypothetical protein AeNC1_011491 [Aphanomyces euteiches]
MVVNGNADVVKKRKKQSRRTRLQRERRERERRELLELRDCVAQLREERDERLQAMAANIGILSWEQVFMALQVDANDAIDENMTLKHKLERMKRVVDGMTKWVASTKTINRGPHTLPYSASHLNLHHVSLTVSDPSCRQHGLDWMTQLLFHNTTALLQRYKFWPNVSTDVQCEYHTDMTNMDDIQLVWRFQVDIPMVMEAVVDPVRCHVVNRLNSTDLWNCSTTAIDPEIVHQISSQMTYVRRIMQHTPTFDESTSCNILYREFNEDTNRTVFVGQTLDDEKFEKREVRSKCMTWVVITRLSPSWTRVSILSLSSLYFTDDGFLPLERQAEDFRLTLGPLEHEQEEAFAREIEPICQFTTAAWLNYMNNAVCAAVTADTQKNDD